MTTWHNLAMRCLELKSAMDKDGTFSYFFKNNVHMQKYMSFSLQELNTSTNALAATLEMEELFFVHLEHEH